MTEEVRATAESGGQKGRKQEAYSLVPPKVKARWVKRLNENGKTSDNQDYMLHALIDIEEVADIQPRLLILLELAEMEMADIFGVRWIEALATVYYKGALKYPDEPGRLNYQKGYPYTWSIDSMWRHYIEHCLGDRRDAESGEPHLAHFMWHIAALLEFIRLGVGTDDRPYIRTREAA